MKRSPLSIQVKRAYEEASPSDGYRVLVDRLWPRGLSQDHAALNSWLQDVAPSTALRKWFAHDPAKWREFKVKYFKELAEQEEAIRTLLAACAGKTLTLVFSAKDHEHNNAVALKEYLEKRLKKSA